ncbi:MAG: cytochrome c maturation protein CcmE domain-containing protein [Chitinophagaceae bacterium]
MKKLNIILLVLIAIAIGVIVGIVGDFSTYETFSTAEARPGKEFHIIAVLEKHQKMVYNPVKDPNYFSFYVRDKKGDQKKVIFTGSEPTDFEKSEQIVLTGKMEGNDFQCSQILMKCPSKYKATKLPSTKIVGASY